MQGSNVQISELIEAIFERTSAGSLRWSESAEAGKFQARIGDYIIHLGARSIGLPYGPNRRPGWASNYADFIELVVTRVDGQVLEAIGGQQNALSMTRGSPSYEDKQKLAKIYERVTGTNPEIDDLISLLKKT